MDEILEDLRETLKLIYLGVVSNEGFVVFSSSEDSKLNIEEIIVELSEIINYVSGFAKNVEDTKFENVFLELKNNLRILIKKINEEYYFISILNKNSYLGKVNFFLEENKDKIDVYL